MTAMRNILIHEYFGVNLSTVWQTVQGRLPALKQQLLSLQGMRKIGHGKT